MTKKQDLVYTPEKIMEMLQGNMSRSEIYAITEGLVDHVNECLEKNLFADIALWSDPLQQLCNKYTNVSRDEAFAACLKAENPMKTAILKLTFKTIAVSEAGVKKGKKVPAQIKEREMDIDLLALKRYAKGHGGKQIGAVRNWDNMAQKLNYRLSFRKGNEVGDPKWKKENLTAIADNFLMSDLAREFKFKADPADAENCKAALQEMVDAMIGTGYTVDENTVNWVLSCFGTKGRTAKQLIMPNARGFVMILRDACNKLLVGDNFIADSKSFKKK